MNRDDGFVVIDPVLVTGFNAGYEDEDEEEVSGDQKIGLGTIDRKAKGMATRLR